jgi:hypothetical protein
MSTGRSPFFCCDWGRPGPSHTPENSENGGVTAIFRVFKVAPPGSGQLAEGRNFENFENGGDTVIFKVFKV